MLKLLKKSLRFIIPISLAMSVGSFSLASDNGTIKAKNVIMLIPDGMSVNCTAIARYMLDGNENGVRNLTMDEYVTALVKTNWANGPITDSAPAGTALATGYKSLTGALGVDSNKLPKATILEAAQLSGKAVGLIATSEFMHATPASYSAHEMSRSNYATIAEQMLNQGLDVLLGTGSGQSKVKSMDIPKLALSKGYTVVNTKTEMEKASSSKLWGDFGNKLNLAYDFDRAIEEPSLEDMTKKAIDVLKNNNDGFFLMVEGSKIDWAAHANDTVGIISDVLAFDKAFKVALDFAKQDKNTVVISVTDHGNSGISIGSYDLTGYDSAPFSILRPLRGAKKTVEGAMTFLKSDKSNIDEVLSLYGINPQGYQPADASSSDMYIKNNAKVNQLIDAFKQNPISSNLVKIMNQLAFIGYTTGGHTGEDVPLYVYIPEGITAPHGLIENTSVAKFIADIMGLNLDESTNKLFVDVTNREGAKIENNTLTLKQNGKILIMKANQSTCELNGDEISLNGEIAVFINGRFYIPQSALNLLVGTSFEISSQKANPGKDVDVKVIVKNMDHLGGFKVNLQYDNNNMTLKNVSFSSQLSNNAVNTSVTGHVYFNAIVSEALKSSTMEIAALKFTVNPNTEVNQSLPISIIAAEACDENTNEISLTTVNGEVSVIPLVLPKAKNVYFTGEAVVGQELTAHYEYYDESNRPESGTSIRWLAAAHGSGNYIEISGANSDKITLTKEFIGKDIRVEITPKNTEDIGVPVAYDNGRNTILAIGDVNKDGKINYADALGLMQAIVGKYEFDLQAKIAADVNKSGDLNINDATIILKADVGLIEL